MPKQHGPFHNSVKTSYTASDFPTVVESAQDSVGTVVDSTLVYTDSTPALGRAAITGNVTIAAGSNSAVIANDAITFAKMQNVGTTKLIGRSTASTGDPEELSIASTLSLSAGTLSLDWTHVVLGSDQTTSARGALADLSGMSFTPAASKIYYVEAYIPWSSTATGTGFEWCFTDASGATWAVQAIERAASASTTSLRFGDLGVSVADTTTAAISTKYSASGWCMLSSSANPSGALKIQVSASVGSSGTITIYKGAFISYRIVSVA